MGTRCLTRVFDFKGAEIICLYRQFDGYPDGHGAELREFLDGFKIVNGLNNLTGKIANGMGCLAAQLVAHFKADHGPGGFYLYPPGAKDVGEEFVYEVRPSGDPIPLGVGQHLVPVVTMTLGEETKDDEDEAE
jgi:hypothetical protein